VITAVGSSGIRRVLGALALLLHSER
jgi:hypothetical protein